MSNRKTKMRRKIKKEELYPPFDIKAMRRELVKI